MKLWMSLYAMIWVVFIEFLLEMTPGASIVLRYLHIVLGLVIIGLAWYNFNRVRWTTVPGRVKRIAKVTFQLSVVIGILGLLLYFGFGTSPILFGITFRGNVVVGFAIITQAAAVAIAYDMWEDKEFAKEAAPGDVPVQKLSL